MRILFASLRNTSHFLPLVPFIRACLACGHEVAVAAPDDLVAAVQKTGARLFPVAHPGDEGLKPYWMRMRQLSDSDAKDLVIREIFAGVCARTALPSLLETLLAWKPDVIVRESQEYASLVAAQKLGVPHARVGITTRSSELPLIGVASAALDEHRKGLDLPLDPEGSRILQEAVLTLFPQTFDAQTVPAPVLRFREARKVPAALPDFWPGQTGPLVYLTLGTVIGTMSDMRSAYVVALEAVSTLPIRVLLTTGKDLPREALGEVPKNVHVEQFVPQDDVLPHAAAVICHGGSGTVIGTLAAGVPMVVMPMFADQPNNAAQVTALGAGIGLRAREATAIEIRGALRRVLENASFRGVASSLAAEIAALAPIEDSVLALERIAGKR